MTASAIIKASESLGRHQRIRWILGEHARRSVARAGVVIADYLGGPEDTPEWRDHWREEVLLELKATDRYSSVWLILIAQIVLPILLRWLIDNWTD